MLKLNNSSRFPDMFEVEAKSLRLLQSSKSFQIPEIISFNQTGQKIYLLMEFIQPGKQSVNFWTIFAEKLALLHQNTQEQFGLDYSNYIGSLAQNNFTKTTDAARFYIENRLKPQFELAAAKGFYFQELELFFQKIEKIIPPEPASLIHGDLWNGNYLVSAQGNPVLIDPAVSYAPREMDLAMMQLFGGFPPIVFRTYHEIFPLKKDAEKRLKLWQLYYLLVHLNLFGASYLPSVQASIKTYI